MSSNESAQRVGAGAGVRVDELNRFMELYQQGDESATVALIDAASPMLLRFFLHYPGNRDQAADLLQETWLRVHKVRHTYRPGASVVPWLYAIALCVRADGFRRRMRVSSRELSTGSLPEVLVGAEDSAGSLPAFEALTEALPENEREVVTMLKVTGMSLADVARATGCSVGAVKQRAHRAYGKLRQVLQRHRAGKGSLAQ